MAETRLRDADVVQLSLDLQHNIAYDAARLAAEALMAAEGYRTGPGEGQHAAVFEFMGMVGDGVFGDRQGRFDQARRLRNMTTYERAGLTSEPTAMMLKRHARRLLEDIRQWIAEQHPELVEPPPADAAGERDNDAPDGGL